MLHPSFWSLTLIVALITTPGFTNFIYFVSLCYGAAQAAQGVITLLFLHSPTTLFSHIHIILHIIYGIRLFTHLYLRSRTSSYASVQAQRKRPSPSLLMSGVFWIFVTILYQAMFLPAIVSLSRHHPAPLLATTGLFVQAVGLVLEAAADFQKSQAKSRAPNTLVTTGLFSIVRCPAYFGEVLFYVGNFLAALDVYTLPQAAFATFGLVTILSIMISATRRLTTTHHTRYGSDASYIRYNLIPFVY